MKKDNLNKAIRIASIVHAGTKGKSKEPAILHPIRVMMKMDDKKSRIVAVLHDVVESKKMNLDDNQIVSNIHKYGNTTAASIPIALCESIFNNKLNKGNKCNLHYIDNEVYNHIFDNNQSFMNKDNNLNQINMKKSIKNEEFNVMMKLVSMSRKKRKPTENNIPAGAHRLKDDPPDATAAKKIKKIKVSGTESFVSVYPSHTTTPETLPTHRTLACQTQSTYQVKHYII